MGSHSILVRRSHDLIERSHAAIGRLRDRVQRSTHCLSSSLERVVWSRDLMGQHDEAREAVLVFVDLAKGCGLSASETLQLLKEMVRTAKRDAGDTQSGGALEQAVLRWGKAACNR